MRAIAVYLANGLLLLVCAAGGMLLGSWYLQSTAETQAEKEHQAATSPQPLNAPLLLEAPTWDQAPPPHMIQPVSHSVAQPALALAFSSPQPKIKRIYAADISDDERKKWNIPDPVTQANNGRFDVYTFGKSLTIESIDGSGEITVKAFHGDVYHSEEATISATMSKQSETTLPLTGDKLAYEVEYSLKFKSGGNWLDFSPPVTFTLKKPPITKPVIASIGDGDIVWQGSDLRRPIRVRLRKSTVSIKLANSDRFPDDVKYSLIDIAGADTSKPVQRAIDGTLTVEIPMEEARSYRLHISQDTEIEGGPAQNDSDAFTLIPPMPSDKSDFVVDAYANGIHATPKGGTVTLYRETGYLKLSGTGLPENAQLDFLVTNANEEVVPVTVQSELVRGSGTDWSATLHLPGSSPASGNLWLLVVNNEGQHRYHKPAISFTRRIHTDVDRLQIVSILKNSATDGGAPNSPNSGENAAGQGGRTPLKRWNGRYFTNSPTGVLNIETTPANESQLVVFRNGVILPTAEGNPDKANIETNATLLNGFNTLQAVVYQGEKPLKRSNNVTISYLESGPKVESIDDRSFRFVPGDNTIRIRFDSAHPLDPSVAEDKSKYPLTARQLSPAAVQDLIDRNTDNISDANGKALLAELRKNVRDPKLVKVDFDRESNTVTLEYDYAPAGLYELTISQSITDLHGNGLNKTSNAAADADDEKHRINKSTEVTLPSQTRGIAGLTGPNIEYPEFTKPRNVPDGFNPSDKVVTRVARLYYFRDAHRVVQLINRDAKSYNRQAVDSQQQLADQSRSRAEAAEDDRRTAQRSAIRSAQSARRAEAALRTFQQDLLAANREVQRLATQRDQADDRLARLNTEIDRAETPVGPPLPEAELNRLKSDRDEVMKTQDRLLRDQRIAEDAVTIAEQRVNGAIASVEATRVTEMQATEDSAQAEARESRAFSLAFNRTTAANRVDPDTYAAGKIDSDDPIRQVSLSVIGEGMIQLRGPIKGVNLARTQINQLDAPVGQTRIALHTIQVNGEHGERMEPVVARIQRYVDHSRFLTTHSAEMLRKAVVMVAGRRAEAACVGGVALTQEMRDMKYQEAFFGTEFIAELRSLDSEFLRTGNKLLSLHSMDTTSLSSALFLLALAKNDVRMEIMREFEAMVQFQLPMDEREYFDASGAEYKFGPLFHRKKFKFFAQNARFVSLRGFFNAEIGGPDTLTPIQREFIRLAQIFKSRLVTEIEFRQRVMERALIEERLGDYEAELRKARNKEEVAEEALLERRRSIEKQQIQVLKNARSVQAYAENIETQARESRRIALNYFRLNQSARRGILEKFKMDAQRLQKSTSKATQSKLNELFEDARERSVQTDRQLSGLNLSQLNDVSLQAIKILSDDPNVLTNKTLRYAMLDLAKQPMKVSAELNRKRIQFNVTPQGMLIVLDDPTNEVRRQWDETIRMIQSIRLLLSQFALEHPHDENFRLAESAFDQAMTTHKKSKELDVNRLIYALTLYRKVADHVSRTASDLVSQLQKIGVTLASADANVAAAFTSWIQVKQSIRRYVVRGELLKVADKHVPLVDGAFVALFESQAKLDFALETAKDSRRPLDHKKFLDMLIDDVEEKHIDLVEGTRAHTANIDNYIKRISTALEDDFNTQFYDPAFRAVRETSQYWDVQFGQVESSDILTNNRTYARVEPRATMEFDLPKRDILSREAFEVAAGLYGEYGALMGDPNFLALTKMFSGQPTANTFNSGFPNPMVRGVLPSLPAGNDERMMIQSDAHAADFASPLESLIPDPAIYSFETGVAWDVRPVIQPDGQAVVFHLNYMYTTNVREPVRADEKHLGRVKRHFIDTDVQLSNYELRQVSKYRVALKASRTSRGVPLLEDVPGLGILFRPLPQQESSLQENVIMAQTVIYPTLFDLMGLRWAPAVADLGPLRLREEDFTYRNRMEWLRAKVYDRASERVDEFMRIPRAERRSDLYRTQETIPYEHPNGYRGPGLHLRDSELREGYGHEETRPESPYIHGRSPEGDPLLPVDPRQGVHGPHTVPLQELPPERVYPHGMGYNSTREPTRRRANALQTPPATSEYSSQQTSFRPPFPSDSHKPRVTTTPMRVTAPVETHRPTSGYSSLSRSRGRLPEASATQKRRSQVEMSSASESISENSRDKIDQASHEEPAPKTSRLLRFFRRGSKRN